MSRFLILLFIPLLLSGCGKSIPIGEAKQSAQPATNKVKEPPTRPIGVADTVEKAEAFLKSVQANIERDSTLPGNPITVVALLATPITAAEMKNLAPLKELPISI